MKEFLKRKNIVISARRYGVDALGAMAQGLFCSLLIGTILKTVGDQCGVAWISSMGAFASAMAGPAMAIAIGSALQAPPLVLFSLAAVGYAANQMGGAGGPLAVLFIAILSAECGKLVSKETKIDILVTPLVTIFVGAGLSILVAPYIGVAAGWVGNFIQWATNLRPFWMGILISVVTAGLFGTLLTLFSWLGEKLLKREAFGLGDVKLIAGFAACLGALPTLWIMFAGSLVAVVFMPIYTLRHSKFKRRGFAFGPFLSLGLALWLLFGIPLTDAVLYPDRNLDISAIAFVNDHAGPHTFLPIRFRRPAPAEDEPEDEPDESDPAPVEEAPAPADDSGDSTASDPA